MYSLRVKGAGWLIATLLLLSNYAYAAGGSRPEGEADLEGPVETGPVKAAKESASFDEFLDGETVFGGKFTTWLELASDYVFRGESETNDGKIPSIKAAITWAHPSGVYLGYYGANNLFPGNDPAGNNPDINALWGPYAGFSKKDIAGTGLNYNGMFFQYIYPGSNESNYLEMFNYVDKQFGRLNLKLEYSPTITDWFGVKGLQSHNVAVHPSFALPHGFILSGSLGYQFFHNSGPNLDADGDGHEELNWTHWNVGISRKVLGYNVDFRYHDTDIDVGHNDFYGFQSNHQIVDQRYVIAVSRTF